MTQRDGDKDYRRLIETLRDSDSVGRALPLDMAANAIEELLAARSAIEPPTEVWNVYSKTSSALFATEEDAKKYISSMPPSVGGGMHISKMPVFRVGVMNVPA